MILVDTSVWVDHLRRGDQELARLLADVQVLSHPAVLGEMALASLARRDEVLELLSNLPRASVATDGEVRALIQNRQLFGGGIGYVDAHLLAATLLTSDADLWTRDKQLRSVAADLDCAATGLR